MTVLMQCLGCGTVVTNPKTMNYMYEKCDVCYYKHKEQEELAIDTYLHGLAEQKRDSNVS
jgi:hypothetical protein